MGRLTVKDKQGYWTLKGVPWKDLCEGKGISSAKTALPMKF